MQREVRGKMITRETIQELTQHESKSGCAITFYFQPSTPKDQSHREESILLKDLVRNALRSLEMKNLKSVEHARADLDRILSIAETIHGNSGMGKVIFADSENELWREFDVPPRLTATTLIVNRRFHLKPLAPIMQNVPRIACCLLDRSRARLFNYVDGDVKEFVDFFNALPRRSESEGWAGYDAGHVERSISESAKQHYKHVGETLVKMYDRDGFDMVAFGCRDEKWPEIESILHTYIRKNLLGYFRIDPTTDSVDAIRTGVEKLLKVQESNRRQLLLHEVTGEAHRNANGALGLRRVLRALEQGEIQTLFIGDKFSASGTECANCGHLDLGAGSNCALCGQASKAVEDLADIILGRAMRTGIEVIFAKDNSILEKAGHIAALLRFRADQNTPLKVAS